MLENKVSDKLRGELEDHWAFVLLGGEGKHVRDQEVKWESSRGGVASDRAFFLGRW